MEVNLEADSGYHGGQEIVPAKPKEGWKCGKAQRKFVLSLRKVGLKRHGFERKASENRQACGINELDSDVYWVCWL